MRRLVDDEVLGELEHHDDVLVVGELRSEVDETRTSAPVPLGAWGATCLWVSAHSPESSPECAEHTLNDFCVCKRVLSIR